MSDLDCQFTGRGQDKSSGPGGTIIGSGFLVVFFGPDQARQQGYKKSCGLAGSGL